MVNLSITITGLVISLLGLVQVLSGRLLEKTTRRYLLLFFAVLVAYAASDLVCHLSDLVLGSRGQALSMVGLFLESLFSASLIPLLTSFLLYTCGEKEPRKNVVFRLNCSLLAVYFGLLIYTQFSTTIYYYDEMNVYHRGPWYPVLLVPPVIMMALNLLLLWIRRKELTRRQQVAFGAYILIPGVSMILQMLFYGIYVIVLGSSIAAFVMLTYMTMDQTEYFYRQKAEIANMKNEIMLSQIQPHFIFNTLGAIEHLSKDSPEVKQAIHTFSLYLRGNINVLSRDAAMISFEKELEHTRLYLQLEGLRFGDNLHVEYDLQRTDFMIPTLTLQPLVENAVRHGVRGNPDGIGTVRIAAQSRGEKIEITVEDNGPGFSPETEKQDGRVHVGIANVRERLRASCGGELIIDSEPGKGTRATILLPEEKGH